MLAITIPCTACDRGPTKNDYMKVIIAEECGDKQSDAELFRKCRRRVTNGLAPLTLRDMKKEFPPPDMTR